MCIGNAIKRRNKVNQKFLNKSHILSDKHWEFIKEIVSKPLEAPLTLGKILELLKAKYDEWNGVSSETLRKFIKSKVKMSFKRISLIEQKRLPLHQTLEKHWGSLSYKNTSWYWLRVCIYWWIFCFK